MTGWTIGGVDIRNLGFNIVDVSGWDIFPGLNAEPPQQAFSHGERFDGRFFYRARDLTLSMTVLDRDIDGSQDVPLEHIEEHIDTLFGILHNTRNPVAIVRTMPSGEIRTASGRVIQAVPVVSSVGVTRAMIITFRMFYPLWHVGSLVTLANQNGSFNITNDGNAPINDMVVTFDGIGRLTVNASGDYIETTTSGLVVDVGARRATISAVDNINKLRFNRPWWIELEPGVNAMTATAQVDISYYHTKF